MINSLYYKLDASLVVLGHSLCIGSDSLAVLWRAHIISLSMYVHACWSVLYRSASFCLCPVLDSEIFYLTSGWFAWRIFVSLHVNTWKWCFIHCLLLHTTTCLSNVSHFAMAVMHFALQLLIILEFFLSSSRSLWAFLMILVCQVIRYVVLVLWMASYLRISWGGEAHMYAAVGLAHRNTYCR